MAIARSNKPIFWSLFGGGGLLAALIGPLLVLIVSLLIPLGIVFRAQAMDYEHVRAFAANPLARIAIAGVIGLFLFHGMHRLYHTLHDLGWPITPAIKAACHGLAALGTIAAIVLVVSVG